MGLDPDSLKLEQQVCFGLYSAINGLVRTYKPLLGELGLTYLQYLVMLVLWEDGALSVSEIGLRLGLDSGTLTPLLKRLETAGLLTRRRVPEDQRRVCIELTTAGRELHARALGIPDAKRCRLALEPEEIASLKAALLPLTDLCEVARLRQSDLIPPLPLRKPTEERGPFHEDFLHRRSRGPRWPIRTRSLFRWGAGHPAEPA